MNIIVGGLNPNGYAKPLDDKLATKLYAIVRIRSKDFKVIKFPI
jgi:hypothetical protein